MLAEAVIDKPSRAFNLVHITMALTLSGILFGTTPMDILAKSGIILVSTSIGTTLLMLLQPFEHIFWAASALLPGKGTFSLRQTKWIYWSIYTSDKRMAFTGGCYFILSILIFFTFNPLGISEPWRLWGQLLFLPILPVVAWNVVKAKKTIQLAWWACTLESEIAQFLIQQRKEAMKRAEGVYVHSSEARSQIRGAGAINGGAAELELHVTKAREAMKLITEAKRILIVGYPLEASPLLVLAREVMGISFRKVTTLDRIIDVYR